MCRPIVATNPVVAHGMKGVAACIQAMVNASDDCEKERKMARKKLRYAVLIMALALLIAGCGGGGGSSSEKTSPDRAASPLVLEAMSLEYGAELTWNQERFEGAGFTLCYAAEQTEANSVGATPDECFFYEKATITNNSVSPMTLTGLDGGQRYWMQLEAVMASGETIYSDPIRVTPSISDEALLGTDAWDWESAPDLDAEKSAISRQSDVFQQAMNNRDVAAATAVIAEDQRDVYEALFDNNPDAMPAFGVLFDQARISFLSPPEDPEGDTTARTAEYEIELDDFTFYVRWMKDGDTWVLFDF